MCEFSKRNGKDLLCSLNNRPCIYRKYCQKVDSFIHLDEWSECYLRNDELKRKIPEGSCYVRFERNGFLYVEYKGNVIRIKNTIGEVGNFVYVKRYRGAYSISLEPFKNKTSKTNHENN